MAQPAADAGRPAGLPSDDLLGAMHEEEQPARGPMTPASAPADIPRVVADAFGRAARLTTIPEQRQAAADILREAHRGLASLQVPEEQRPTLHSTMERLDASARLLSGMRLGVEQPQRALAERTGRFQRNSPFARAIDAILSPAGFQFDRVTQDAPEATFIRLPSRVSALTVENVYAVARLLMRTSPDEVIWDREIAQHRARLTEELRPSLEAVRAGSRNLTAAEVRPIPITRRPPATEPGDRVVRCRPDP